MISSKITVRHIFEPWSVDRYTALRAGWRTGGTTAARMDYGPKLGRSGPSCYVRNGRLTRDARAVDRNTQIARPCPPRSAKVPQLWRERIGLFRLDSNLQSSLRSLPNSAFCYPLQQAEMPYRSQSTYLQQTRRME
ncbi:hypothetical protein CALCODRAFT_372252 [Calocera cornea HHB12733]|uniref:Uncharacterized protein n=1 Tax=Calocera cornea HHB12733 TaxID=1353952 RepID=A0A165EGQ3_9BASI|nr:hypothetical protein CALCODRAFT_372252 [Calocera cornea HHB12733]